MALPIRGRRQNGHKLIFGASDAYGNAKLAMWRGGKRYRTLVRRRYKVDTHDECFELDGISSDGKRVYYRYSNDSLPQSYRITLTPGGKPQKINAKHGVWDKHV